MLGTNLILVGGALVVGVVAGLVAHEWAHAVALRAAGIDYVVEVFPDRDGTVRGLLASCPWAQVRPLPTERDPAWALRFAALAPIVLALPVAALTVADHAPTGDVPVLTALVIGWLACAIPSPQDFSVAFYAHALLETADPSFGPVAEDATTMESHTRSD